MHHQRQRVRDRAHAFGRTVCLDRHGVGYILRMQEVRGDIPRLRKALMNGGPLAWSVEVPD